MPLTRLGLGLAFLAVAALHPGARAAWVAGAAHALTLPLCVSQVSASQVAEVPAGRGGRIIQLPALTLRPADGRLLQLIRAELQAIFQGSRAVTAGRMWHDYTIIAYDAASDMVTIRAPDNRNGWEIYPDGTRVAISGGVFALSTAQMANYFEYLRFEPAEHPLSWAAMELSTGSR